eukprot:TRINITY_DN125554_c0_g1_i1.p1 TRINITY_DN125554_c0_g1~~TRINITY_DN125554_c0_g1_i1.p1  ORF type:complete len:295 (-),score=26.33 TRINITY_DN125554_c0_g1_i1:164-1048(-)
MTHVPTVVKKVGLERCWIACKCTDVAAWFSFVGVVYALLAVAFFCQATTPVPSRAEWLYRSMLFDCRVEPYLVDEARCQEMKRCEDAAAGQASRRLFEVPSIYSEGVPGSTVQGCATNTAGEVRCCATESVGNFTMVAERDGPWAQAGCVVVRVDPRGRRAVDMKRLLGLAPKKCLWIPGMTTAEGVTYQSEIVIDTLINLDGKHISEIRDPVQHKLMMQWLTPILVVFCFISWVMSAYARYKQWSVTRPKDSKVSPEEQVQEVSAKDMEEVGNISVVVVAASAVAAAVVSEVV